jgi:hypothetical protein
MLGSRLTSGRPCRSPKPCWQATNRTRREPTSSTSGHAFAFATRRMLRRVRCRTLSTQSSRTRAETSQAVLLTTSMGHWPRINPSRTATLTGSWITWTTTRIPLLSGCVQSAKATCRSKRTTAERPRAPAGSTSGSTEFNPLRAHPCRSTTTSATTVIRQAGRNREIGEQAQKPLPSLATRCRKERHSKEGVTHLSRYRGIDHPTQRARSTAGVRTGRQTVHFSAVPCNVERTDMQAVSILRSCLQTLEPDF